LAVLGSDNFLEGMVGLGANLHGFSESSSTSWKKHELLKGKLVPRVRSAVDNIECGAGKYEWRLDTSQISKMLVERHSFFGSSSLSYSNGHSEDGIGAEFPFVGRTIKLDEEIVDLFLFRDFETRFDQLRSDHVVYISNGFADALSKEVSNLEQA
jgi:hypothetical protein